jgi:hypothetical protein
VRHNLPQVVQIPLSILLPFHLFKEKTQTKVLYLAECRYLDPHSANLKSLNINFNRYQIVELYMAIGGIPHYLNEVEAGLSAAQNIERICFSPSGLLNNEFSRLYPALFDNADNHIAVIKALAEKWQGLTRTDIVALSILTNFSIIQFYKHLKIN